MKLKGVPVPDFGPFDEWSANKAAAVAHRKRRADGVRSVQRYSSGNQTTTDFVQAQLLQQYLLAILLRPPAKHLSPVSNSISAIDANPCITVVCGGGASKLAYAGVIISHCQ